MIRLAPMTEEQYEAFAEISARDQMEGHVREGRWKTEEAEANMAKLTAQFLPEGQSTANHFFYAIEEEDTGALAGGLWYMLAEGEGTRHFFVVDIQIYEAYRRRGYGTQAFLAMEDQARDMGVTTIALHLFADNHPARAMYRKLGYAGTDTSMAKQIG
ncbi:MAG: GNAT family N-acetyltransferase [Anaerolineae bacterium]|nr:GNAT family N-acetyltransferase [Anaerolineae bacterium]